MFVRIDVLFPPAKLSLSPVYLYVLKATYHIDICTKRAMLRSRHMFITGLSHRGVERMVAKLQATKLALLSRDQGVSTPVNGPSPAVFVLTKPGIFKGDS